MLTLPSVSLLRSTWAVQCILLHSPPAGMFSWWNQTWGMSEQQPHRACSHSANGVLWSAESGCMGFLGGHWLLISSLYSWPSLYTYIHTMAGAKQNTSLGDQLSLNNLNITLPRAILIPGLSSVAWYLLKGMEHVSLNDRSENASLSRYWNLNSSDWSLIIGFDSSWLTSFTASAPVGLTAAHLEYQIHCPCVQKEVL